MNILYASVIVFLICSFVVVFMTTRNSDLGVTQDGEITSPLRFRTFSGLMLGIAVSGAIMMMFLIGNGVSYLVEYTAIVTS